MRRLQANLSLAQPSQSTSSIFETTSELASLSSDIPKCYIYRTSVTNYISRCVILVVAFGWSAGDIVAGIRLTVKICEAFKESGGAASKYKQTVDFLDGLKLTLEHLKSYVDGNPTDSHASSISEQIEKIKEPFEAFRKTVEKYEKSLSGSSRKRRIDKAPRTIKWALKEMSGDVEKLKIAISHPLQNINTLLSLQLLHTLGKLPEQLLSPAQCRQLIDAIRLADIPSELKEQISTLKQSELDYHLEAQASHGQQLEELEGLVRDITVFETSITSAIATNSAKLDSQARSVGETLEQLIKRLPQCLSSTQLENLVQEHQMTIMEMRETLENRLPDATMVSSADESKSRWANSESGINAGHWATMMFSSIITGVAASYISTKPIPKLNDYNQLPYERHLEIPPATFETNMLPSPSQMQRKCLYECSFWFLNCWYTSYNKEVWRSHCFSHFRGEEPPKSGDCPLCEDFRATFESGHDSWSACLEHMAWHQEQGQASRSLCSDVRLLRHLWQKRLIDNEEYQNLIFENSLIKVPRALSDTAARQHNVQDSGTNTWTAEFVLNEFVALWDLDRKLLINSHSKRILTPVFWFIPDYLEEIPSEVVEHGVHCYLDPSAKFVAQVKDDFSTSRYRDYVQGRTGRADPIPGLVTDNFSDFRGFWIWSSYAPTRKLVESLHQISREWIGEQKKPGNASLLYHESDTYRKWLATGPRQSHRRSTFQNRHDRDAGLRDASCEGH